MIEYPPGTPSWVDLGSPDPDASATFYRELFGWETSPAADDYRLFRHDGASVAGLALAEGGRPPVWTTYIAVGDAVAAVARVEAAGGKTLTAPTVVPGDGAGDAGTVAIFSDGADGAVFGVWQPGRHRGAELVNAPGALSMNELDSRDLDGAARFYGSVFGWSVEPIEVGGQVVYGSVQLGGRLVAGMLPMGPHFPAAIPAHWVPYFGVDDVEAAAERAKAAGGGVTMGPQEVPSGRFYALHDPHGASFCIFEGTYDPPPGG
jgi:uncharacterized protein